MTAITWSRAESEEGLVPFDGRRHLRQVAELIGAVFADELDTSGRSALQEMEVVSRLSPLLGGLLSSTFFSEFVLGYVWVDNGSVVGNVTFQRTEMSGTRWRISNVAVAAEQRQHGIAKALMQATLREIAVRGGSWAVLQVRVDNSAARHLYQSLGFADVCQDGIWQRPPLPITLLPEPPADGAAEVSLRRLRGRDWQDGLELARAARSQLAYWAEPVDASNYQPGLGKLIGEALGNLTGFHQVARWGGWHNGQLFGAVEAVAANAGNQHQLRFDVRPGAPAGFAKVLIRQGLRFLASAPIRPIVAEHSGDDSEGVAALQACGFRPLRVLLTMRRLMTPADV
jgi:ribosomal protein S18 acetylase RimI-like enzyme